MMTRSTCERRVRQRTMQGLIMLVSAATLVAAEAHAWGWEAHRWTTQAAIGILPDAMRSMIAPRGEAIVEHAPDPDHWKDDPLEHNRHWIDLELGDATGLPFEGLPRYKAEALRKFGADSLGKIGVLPWRIEEYFDKLVTSMAAPSGSTWVHFAALGHYVADATQPMHATLNYDGQLTGNRGIHFRFEWWMLEQHRDQFRLNPRQPILVLKPLPTAWAMVLDAYAGIDTLLAADTALRREFREPAVNERGRGVADPEYDAKLWDRLGPIATDRLDFAAQAIAGYWYLAWQKAGKPDLSGLPGPPDPPEER
jgi:hypothetical protein